MKRVIINFVLEQKVDMGSSSSNSPESLNGLKFGQKIYFEDMGAGIPVKSVSGSDSLTVPKKSGQPARCQVEGCGVDLSDAKVYYSRHKVCGMHSKSPMVTVAGLQQRFCQQCSRFHLLPEFDQGKRSCRRRLAGHNERRRKPPSVPLYTMQYRPPASSISDPGMIPTDSWLTARGYGTQTYFPGPAYDHDGVLSDSSCAYSLLSKQPTHTRNPKTTTNLRSNYNMVESANAMTWGLKDNGTTRTQFSGPSGGFKDGEGSSAVLDLGLSQVSHLLTCQYSGEVDLAGQIGRQRALGSLSQHGHWSL